VLGTISFYGSCELENRKRQTDNYNDEVGYNSWAIFLTKKSIVNQGKVQFYFSNRMS
jgi:hypothetical protein